MTSLDVDILRVRLIYARGTNQTLSANNVLVTDGIGGTRWINISTINAGLGFNTINTTASTFTSSSGNTTFSILDSSNIGLIPTNNGAAATLFSKSFGQIDVPGQSSIYSFDSLSGSFNNQFSLTGTGIISISTNTLTNQINFYSPNDATSSLSSLIKNMSSVNTTLTNAINSFQSPFSTFLYSIISSFSTSLGPTVQFPQLYSTFSTFSTVLGPTVQFPQLYSTFSTFSTALGPTVQFPQLYSTFSTFSTVLGPTVQFPQLYSTFSTFSTVLGRTVQFPQLNSTFSTFSTVLGPTVQFPQLNSTFSTFSTALGRTITTSMFASTLSTNISRNLYTEILYTSTINVSGNRQPFIQYGIGNLSSMSTIVTLNSPYINSNYIIQLTYASGTTALTVPISFSTVTTSNFVAYGVSTAIFHWTSYGNLF